MDLRAEFDRAYDAIHQPMPALDAYINDEYLDVLPLEIPLGSVDMPEDVALRMMNENIAYWEHYGWGSACFAAIYGLASEFNYYEAQRLASWLHTGLCQVKGYQSVSYLAELSQFASAQFPVKELKERNAMVKALKDPSKRKALTMPAIDFNPSTHKIVENGKAYDIDRIIPRAAGEMLFALADGQTREGGKNAYLFSIHDIIEVAEQPSITHHLSQ